MSRRDRARFTRPDSTGFTDNSRAESKLRTASLDDDLAAAQAAVEAQRATERPLTDAKEASVSEPTAPGVTPAHDMPPPIVTKTPAAERKPVEKGVVDLVLPPGVGCVRFTLRMDVLERQAVELRGLAETGVPIENVLRAAAAKVDFFKVKEEYVPQVVERRARGIVHRVEVRLPHGFFDRVEKMVRGGEAAQRKALLAGQFEREWFAAVDEVIERMKR